MKQSETEGSIIEKQFQWWTLSWGTTTCQKQITQNYISINKKYYNMEVRCGEWNLEWKTLKTTRIEMDYWRKTVENQGGLIKMNRRLQNNIYDMDV